jgi:alpha-tubulin suppressor-like RCC1 family protein
LLSSEGYIYSAGLSEFGQLGNGETGEYFVSASKIAFANATKFERRSIFVHSPADSEQTNLDEAKKATIPLSDSDDIRIGSISCGKNHTVAVEAQTKNKTHSARVFTWGCGSYGVLGHSVQKDEYTPRFVGVFQGPLFKTNSPVRAAAGAHCSMILTENGHVYYSGKHRSVGEATMRPTLIDVLANNMHVVTSLGGGAQSVFCSTSNGVTVSWGMGLTGELGFGKESAKSSSKPKFVEKLDKCLVTDVACGYGHTLFLIRDEDAEDKAELKKISKIEVSDLSAFVEKVTK